MTDILRNHNLLGTAWGDRRDPRYLSLEDRRRHLLVTGAPGTGKSTLLANLFAQEANAGRGVLLMDDHGDLAQQALTLVPPPRIRKTIYFNASDTAWPVGFNILGHVPKHEQSKRVAEIMKAFRSVWADSWGPRLNHILTFSLSALIEQGDATLLCISRLLLDDGYRKSILSRVTDSKTLEFWRLTFPLYSDQGPEVFTPILNKIDVLLASPQVRNILCNPRARLDMRHLIDNRYIIIVNLSGIGAEPANLLGSLLISTVASAAKSRENIAEAERQPFLLIIDEFTNYTTDEFRSLLSEARKFNLSLVLAHQYLDQMRDMETKKAALGTVGSYVVFRVSGADAEDFQRGPLPDYPAERYTETWNYQAWCRLLCGGRLSNVFTLHLSKPPKAHNNHEKTIAHSRHQWGTPRDVVETRIEAFLNPHKQAAPTQIKRQWKRR